MDAKPWSSIERWQPLRLISGVTASAEAPPPQRRCLPRMRRRRMLNLIAMLNEPLRTDRGRIMGR